jgi:hypothetical protein
VLDRGAQGRDRAIDVRQASHEVFGVCHTPPSSGSRSRRFRALRRRWAQRTDIALDFLLRAAAQSPITASGSLAFSTTPVT